MLAILAVVGFIRAGGNDEVLKPGDSLIAEGIPAIPAALADKAAPYNNFRSASIAVKLIKIIRDS